MSTYRQVRDETYDHRFACQEQRIDTIAWIIAQSNPATARGGGEGEGTGAEQSQTFDS